VGNFASGDMPWPPTKEPPSSLKIPIAGWPASRSLHNSSNVGSPQVSPGRRERIRADDQYFATSGAGVPPIQVIVDAGADDVTVEACRRRQRGGIERRITGDGLIAAEPTPCVKFR
jgi:hypothetical protein